MAKTRNNKKAPQEAAKPKIQTNKDIKEKKELEVKQAINVLKKQIKKDATNAAEIVAELMDDCVDTAFNTFETFLQKLKERTPKYVGLKNISTGMFFTFEESSKIQKKMIGLIEQLASMSEGEYQFQPQVHTFYVYACIDDTDINESFCNVSISDETAQECIVKMETILKQGTANRDALDSIVKCFCEGM